jgi:hypothetical protein
MTQDEFRSLISAAGPLDDTILAIVDLTEDTLLVTLGEADVQVEHDAAGGRAIFTAEIGTPPAGREAAVHRFLLLSNSLLRESGGVVAALTGTGEAALKVALPTAGLLPATVATVAVNLAARAAALNEGFAAGLGETASEPAAPGLGETLIRI